MRRLGIGLLLVILLGLASLSTLRAAEAAPHESSPEIKKALQEVVESQLAAFRAGDFAKAYTFASAEIQAQFSPGDFEGMVKTSYPVIAKSSSADFRAAADTGDDAIIDVHVSAGDKRGGQFRYRLHREDGRWRIAGVLEVKPTGLTV